ncbi:MAG: hypothetical protein J5973_08285 [Eubacterium sp.]|nr:hypothetical protein [Eubacterium sp.]
MEVLCAANAYIQKYYFNEDFSLLPTQIQEELQVLCVTFTEEVGGIFLLAFDEDGSLQIRTEAAEEDALYDEIDSAWKVKQIREEKEELFRSLEMFYRVFADPDGAM